MQRQAIKGQQYTKKRKVTEEKTHGLRLIYVNAAEAACYSELHDMHLTKKNTTH